MAPREKGPEARAASAPEAREALADAPPRAARRRLLRDLVLGLAGAALAASSIALFGRGPHPTSTEGEARREAPSNVTAPWGELDKVPVTFQPPIEHVEPSFCPAAPPRWHFPNTTRAGVDAELAGHGVRDDVRASLVASTSCDEASHTCVVEPSRDVVLGLSPEVRGALYRDLAASEENTQHDPFTRRRERVAEWAKAAELRPGTIEALERLLYFDGDVAEFADSATLCATLDDGERVRLARGLVRTPSLIVHLRVRPDTDREALLGYWGRGRRRDVVGPLLDAAARAKTGATISVVSLLPPLGRARIHTYPVPGEPPYNCWWTALNFWSDHPDDAFMSPKVALASLARDYDETPLDAARFGDLVVFEDADGTPLHVAVHIADDVYLTKNGHSPGRPWTFGTLDDLRVVYPATQKLRAYRRRDLLE